MIRRYGLYARPRSPRDSITLHQAPPVPTAEEEADLLARSLAGDGKARAELVERNVRLVLHVAMEFRRLVVPIEDVIQEGFIGLLRAIDSFDPTRHVRLVAYAGPMIRYAIMDMLKGHMRFIRPPKHIWDIRIKVARLRGRLGLWDEDFEAIAVNRLGVSPKKARKALGCVLTEVQLSTVDPDECESSLARSGAAEAAAERNEASADASASLASLPARQRDALEARFGLGGAAEMNFTEASRSRGVTSECIRKRAESGIEMLRGAMRGHA